MRDARCDVSPYPHHTAPAMPLQIVPSADLAPCTSHLAPAAGSGRLHIDVVDGASAALRMEAHAPLKLLVPCPRGPAVWAFAATFGGGLVAGDRITVDVAVDAGATAVIGTQASTKVYRCETGVPAEQIVTARIANGGTLALIPDPVTCFTAARYLQRQEFDVHEGASLLLIDSLTSGRAARGERWAFTSYESRNHIRRAGRPLLIDALRLDQAAGRPLPDRLGRFQTVSTVVVIGPRFTALANTLLANFSTAPVERGAPLLVSASPLADGALLRIAAIAYEPLDQFLRQHLSATVTALGGDHWQRKP